MLTRTFFQRVAVVTVLTSLTISVLAHEIIVKGTVTAVEPSRVQIKTGEEKKGQPPAWYPLDAKTRIVRGKTIVSFEQARIVIDERVVAIVDHAPDGTMKTLELRLTAK